MISLQNGSLTVLVSHPGEYYRATRFDWAGVFRRIEKAGYVYADEWFAAYNPLTHDAVCGPSEEFVTVDFEHVGVGSLFVKPGVGLLRRPDDAPYDWFRLYEIADMGKWSVKATPSQVVFRQELQGWYEYEKQITLTDSSAFTIGHRLKWLHETPLRGYNYNHNFFTFNGTPVGQGRQIDFLFSPSGHWREQYENVGFEGRGIRFRAPISEGRSVYCGDVHHEGDATSYDVTLREGTRRVRAVSDASLSHYVFWANPHVACAEPYIPIELNRGETKSWQIKYSLE